jgi:predicted dehydrogenase
LQQTFDIPTIYSTSQALLESPDIDAVYIAVPNAYHAPIALQALSAGKHVILDKPFALNLQQAKEVADMAQQQDRVFMLGMNQRFVPGSQVIKNLISSGALGELYHAKACWLRRTGIPRLGTWFGNKALAGGGSLLDIGVHLLDLALYMLDNFEPVGVSGATYSKFGPRGLGEGGWGLSDRESIPFDVDDFATALIKLKGGVTLTLDVSWALHQKDTNLMNVSLFGTEAGATVYPAELYRYGENRGEYQLLQNPVADQLYNHNSRFFNFINSILGEETPCVTIEQALAVQSIIDGIYASCQSGKEVRFN